MSGDGTWIDHARDVTDTMPTALSSLMVDAVRRHLAGEPASGAAGGRAPYVTLQSFEGIVPKGTDWTTMPQRVRQEPAEEHR